MLLLAFALNMLVAGCTVCEDGLPCDTTAVADPDSLHELRNLPFVSASTLHDVLDIHPGDLHGVYLPEWTAEVDTSVTDIVRQASGSGVDYGHFHRWLDVYAKRYGVDDNFSIRVLDSRTYNTLEVYQLEDERRAFLDSGEAPDWFELDKKRRVATRALVKKYRAMGVPNQYITVKWGRLNQVFEARQRDEPFVEYELRLARLHGLSALATEIGTVETFNRDDMVSPVGARGRYQFMPDNLRRMDIHRYTLKADRGRTVEVFEERHPLIFAEHAFAVMRAYANVVGHELPGLSAYHTGPGNIMKIYRLYLENEKPKENLSVMDAYVWALGEGFKTVAKQSTFKNHSRGYLSSAYGAYRATEHLPLDLSKTMKAELVTVRPGRATTLAQLFDQINEHAPEADWGVTAGTNLYENFRAINQHMRLPALGRAKAIPVGGNVRFRGSKRTPVRIFLPLGMAEQLAQAEFTPFDLEKTRRFDEDTYALPSETGEYTLWDAQYEALVKRIGQFGFTESNRRDLFKLADEFKSLAEQNPTSYRKAQYEIIRIHKMMWQTSPYAKLAAALKKNGGVRRATTEPAEAAEPARRVTRAR
ncbi:MAG: hypothetical protein AAF752_00715 [Bacteroidota bacterium]